MKTLFMVKVVAALALLLLVTGSVVLADDVQITRVENSTGTCTVYTDKANTKVKIIRTVKDSDGSEHRYSWTRTTDGQGRVALENVPILIQEELTVELVPETQQAVVEGLVLPNDIYDQQPFSFAVPGTAEGEVVEVQSADGEVLQRTAADRYGRVFLAAGLPAGAYLIAQGGHHSRPVGEIEVKQRPMDTLERPREHPPQPMQLRSTPQAMKLGEPLSLTGHGFSPNCTDMQVNFTGAGQTQSMPVLAATEGQLKLAPLAQLPPGSVELTVTNRATGQSTKPQQVLVYDMQGRLERRKLTSSAQTRLVVNTQPENLALKVRATVLSGPVDFGGGRKESESVTNRGQAVFPVHAEPASGPFKLAWELAPIAAETFANQPDGHNPPPTVPPQDGDCHCTADGGGIDDLKATVSDRPSPEQIDVDAAFESEHDRDGWKKRRKDGPLFDDYLGTLQFNFDILAATATANGTEGHITVKRKTTLTVSSDGSSFQIFRKGKGGKYVPIDNRGENKPCDCPNGRATFSGTPSEEYRVEIFRSKMGRADNRIPDLMTVTVDVADTIDPCGLARHDTRTYQLRFAEKSGVKLLAGVKQIEP